MCLGSLSFQYHSIPLAWSDKHVRFGTVNLVAELMTTHRKYEIFVCFPYNMRRFITLASV